MSTKIERVAEHISNMRAEDVVDLWREYCLKQRYYDDIYEDMPEFDDRHSTMTPLQVAKLVYKQDFNTDADYYKETIWGPTSFDTAQDCVKDMDIDAMVKYIVNNDDWLYDEDIQEILTEEEEEE